MIGLKCPKCQNIMKIDESMVGTEATCPSCRGKFRVPPRRSKSSSPPASKPAGKTNPQAGSAPERQTGYQQKGSLPQSEQAIRPSRTAPISSSPSEEEEFEYSAEDVDEPEVPPPPPRKRPRVEVEDDDEPAVEVEEEEDEFEDDEEEDQDEGEEDEEEEEVIRPRKRTKKKKEESASAAPFVLGALILVLVAACTGVGYFIAFGKKRAPDPAKALAAIEKRGGKVVYDPKDPQTVIEVSLAGTDADNGELEMLRAFPKLKVLNLSRCTKINNPGLEWLVDLKELRVLNFSYCSHVHDGGMEHIGKITSLEELYLNQTIVTDRGLEELTGLKNLKKLYLSGSLASGLGLQRSIPGLEIIS